MKPQIGHHEGCFVYRHAEALLGVDRRGLCTCGFETKVNPLEVALIAAADATEARGLRIFLFQPPYTVGAGHIGAIDMKRIGEAVLKRINELTDGIPICGDESVSERAVHASNARNLQLLLDVYKAWIVEHLK